MNERIKKLALIKKLAIQAEIYAGELIDEGADYDQYPRYYTEKFAELIILECLTICEELGDKGMDGHYCADAISKTFWS